jgi:predicted ATPase
VRLLTLTGPGGVGKTSLAIRAAADLLPDFVDGVFFVSLAPIRDPDLIPDAIAHVLDARVTPQPSLLAALHHALRDRRLLLLLDNFEHVLPAAVIVTELLNACPHLKILATSREPLQLYGEYEYGVPRLLVPETATLFTAETIAASSAVQLFVQRAQAVRSEFALDAATLPPVVQICRRLDGLPLAIELAAARMRHFSAQELLRRFGARYAGNGEAPATLTLLKTSLRNIPDRHRSLWAAIAWSYELLDATEQAIFRQLAVLVGGWTVAAAQAVCSEGLTPDFEETLWSLLDKQLIHRDETGAESTRFMMLETLREFGLEELRRTGELIQTQRRMADYYTTLAEHAANYLTGAESAYYHRLIIIDYPNMRAAWTWIHVHRQADLALRLCTALFIFSDHNPRDGEQMALATLELAADSPPSPKLTEVLMAAGYCAWMLGKLDIAEGYMLRAIEMDEASGHQAHPGYIGVMRGMLAWRSFDRGDYATARAYFAREGELADEAGDDWRIAMNLVNWGRLEWLLGDIDRAAVMLDAALRLHRQVGQRWGLAKALADRAELHFICGELDAATALLAECAPLLQDIDLPDRLAKLYSVRGLLALEQGDCRRAALMQAKALELHAQISYVDGIEDDILCAADVAVQWRRPAHVLCLLGAHAARLQRIGKIDSPLLRQKLGTLIDAARCQLDPADADAAWARGQAMAEEEVVAYALHEVLEPISTQR